MTCRPPLSRAFEAYKAPLTEKTAPATVLEKPKE
jgi:hypothetical protein